MPKQLHMCAKSLRFVLNTAGRSVPRSEIVVFPFLPITHSSEIVVFPFLPMTHGWSRGRYCVGQIPACILFPTYLSIVRSTMILSPKSFGRYAPSPVARELAQNVACMQGAQTDRNFSKLLERLPSRSQELPGGQGRPNLCPFLSFLHWNQTQPGLQPQ